MMNQLGHETSPYLLQHKDNPVDWRAWGEAAFAEAKRENKPILLSVGYAACHWCHVMAHESFENVETAELMNALFVNIKLDREERPDLDAIYQQAVMLMGEQGGWPLTVFLTPEAEPFWGGTYFPPTPRYGRPGFSEVLDSVAAIYRREPDKVRHNAGILRRALEEQARPAPGSLEITPELLGRMGDHLLRLIDWENGGLMGAPKFPQPGLFEFLWRLHLKSGRSDLRHAVLVTLEGMIRGGIHDHLGGGFARYATDEAWLVPHFEKMLYDNALILDLLAEIFPSSPSPLFTQAAQGIVEWLMREMLTESGGFASSQDADSEGEEGRYYVWSAEEVAASLGAKADFFMKLYDVSEGGNWEGKNILNLLAHLPEPEEEEEAAPLRRTLLKIREKRVPPGRDDKILADWNGMAIAALAKAGLVFKRPEWIAAAKCVFASLMKTHGGPDDRLYHSWRARPGSQGLLDDYVQMARAGLALFRATGERSFARLAEGWMERLEQDFRDEAGGYFIASNQAKDLLIRSKSALDGVTPSGNGAALQVLAELFRLTANPYYGERAETLFNAFRGEIESRFPGPLALILGALDLREAVVCSGPDCGILGE
jgi:uncharacterized protein YyaL (SSP411 family)